MSATSGTSSATSGTLGDAAPISFPGIASGIDYNAIIEKYTAETLAQEKPTQLQINNLNSQNTAILKITNLIGSVQDSLTALSNPATFDAYKATVSNTSGGSTPGATATQITGQTPIAGTYIVNAQKAATATSITNSSSANGSLNTTVALSAAGTGVTPTDGTGATGIFTINGVAIKYNVDTESITSIVSAINSALQANDGGSATLNANGTVTLTGVTSIGSGGDSGNLEQVLKLDSAQLSAGTITSSSTIAGINENSDLNTNNNAGFATAVTGGTFTINGVQFTVNPATDSLSDVIAQINASTAGVTATYNTQTSSLTLTNKVPGPQSILLGASGDTSNFLNATGLVGGQSITNNPSANGTLNAGLALDQAGASITATNGGGPTGTFTINGVAVSYDVTTQTIGTIVANINTALQANDGGTAAYNAGTGTVSLTGVTSLGSPTDTGNLEQVLKLNTASIVSGNVSSASAIAGINGTSVLDTNNNAGFASAVTAGTFSINGTAFTVDPTTQSLNNVIAQINASSTAGVTASYNSSNDSIVLTSKTSSAITLSDGTSNFLAAAGLTTGSTTAGAATSAGTQASLTYTNLQGQTNTVYSQTNDFTSAIPGIDLNINTSSPAGFTGTFYTVNVASDPTTAEAAINTFIKAYNAAIQTLNEDTVAPTVQAGTDATTGTSSATSSGGGVLYGNYQISGLRDQLVNLVSGFIPSGSTSYNSLQSVGVELDTNSQAVGTAADSDSSTGSSTSDDTNSANNSFTVNATSGQLQALDTTTFAAAYAADTQAVQNLFTLSPKLSGTQAGSQPVPGASYGFAYLLGSSLSNIDGLTTFLANSAITPDSLSNVLLSSVVDSNNQQIDSLQQQISLINQEATQQADNLRTQFTASESQIAELQALQAQIAAIGH